MFPQLTMFRTTALFRRCSEDICLSCSKEFSEYSQQNLSGLALLSTVSIIVSVSLVWAVNDIIFSQKPELSGLSITSIIIAICIFVMAGLLSVSKSWFPSPYESQMRSAIVVGSALVACLVLIHNSFDEMCDGLKIARGLCSSNIEQEKILPRGPFLIALLTPLLYSSVFKASKSVAIWLSWLMVLVVGVTLSYVVNKTGSINMIIFYIPVSVIIILENHRQDVAVFKLVRALKNVLNENERLAEEARATELRHMIGNVAHDLKTPLSGLMIGVDTIGEIVDDIQLTPSKLVEKLATLRGTLSDMHSINTFMLMTIHRCVDFTKASKGLALIPRYDKFRLTAALEPAISCMNSIQNRMKVSMLLRDAILGKHIITDKQWLQENILCLLSNAVKYSSRGSVILRVAPLANIEALSQSRTERTLSRYNMDCGALSDGATAEDKDFESVDEIALTSPPRRIKPSAVRREASHQSDTSAGTGGVQIFPAESASSREGSTRRHSSRNGVTRTSATIDCSSPMLLFEVEDNGSPLSDERLETLFQPVKQVQKLAGGAGLGLFSLARRIEALRGAYGVERRSDEEEGNVFWFAVPYHTYDAKEEVKHNEDGVGGSNSKSSMDLGPLRILLVDDSHTIQKMMSMLLRKNGHAVDQAENGAEAIEHLSQNSTLLTRYDVVFMDLQMPVMDGLEATRRIREKELRELTEGGIKRHQFIIGLSANSDAASINDAFAAGVDDFISKPFTLAAFVASYRKHQQQKLQHD